MASTSGRKTSASGKTGRSGGRKNTRAKSANTAKSRAAQDGELFREIGLIVLFIAAVILFLCNFGLIGPVGNAVSGVLFGLFGLTAYIAPVVLFLAAAFGLANQGSPAAIRKIAAGAVLFVMTGVVCELIAGSAVSLDKYDISAVYESSRIHRNGGGVVAGSLTFLLHHYLETIGTVLVVVLCSVISFILVTERSLISGIRERGARLMERSAEDRDRRQESDGQRRARREEERDRRQEERRRKDEEKRRRDEERRLRAEEKENERILRMDRKVTGVAADTAIPKRGEGKIRDDIHEITYCGEDTGEEGPAAADAIPLGDLPVQELAALPNEITAPLQSGSTETAGGGFVDAVAENIRVHKEDTPESPAERDAAGPGEGAGGEENADAVERKPEQRSPELKLPKKYMFPPLSCLKKGMGKTGDSTRELKETALHLQQTLATFGVRVTITDISQGPSVTRYELQPEQGVKVSKIVSLTDDIKLNLAATDIRIEAPIPGKAAVGIEVPNKENMMVALRDLLESREFKSFPSNLSFAVGKDIAGKVVVADIARMPHMLVAGATGSGKSVCINTLIMSILYKAHPDEVKLIMVDPKVVELSVYNGIPHLLIPVVTDPKKAAAALHWGVSEMNDRYKKFADFNVRDLKGYNKKAESLKAEGREDAPARLPQIVIIVDELADLMMVSPGEVEESICRLAQLARAAGIHLIIATQRPSVDVITGLIKANMPSRVAFSVSSGVDSRTILDMNGAEKLLGKGDMLFYPQGYSKPARVQGAFVSDKEVSDVVDFLKNQVLGNTYAEEIEEQIRNMGGASGSSGGAGADERDEYFEEAGRFIIDKDKASIGMLQRLLKIGFNRAARIMDQLCEYGVVGEEEGTKPRKVLMTMEQFDQLLEEI